MVSLSLNKKTTAAPVSGLRPVNLRTDLAPLADLIELAFAASMDSSGRAAIREMRSLSHIGAGLSVFSRMNEMAQGVGLGYVWIEDGRLVGNTSIYPASLPHGAPPAWIIANVATHPDFRGRGIARKLVTASLEAIYNRVHQSGRRRIADKAVALLQVEADNTVARGLYERLGFATERTFITWRRTSTTRAPLALDDNPAYVTRRRFREWRAEMALAGWLRPSERGGIGWLRPIVPSVFRSGIREQINDFINMRTFERLLVRDQNDHVRAFMWVESAFAASSVQLTLVCDPIYQGVYDEALINGITRRYSGRSALTIEHPEDDANISTLLRSYQFSPQRTLTHMRWEM